MKPSVWASLYDKAHNNAIQREDKCTEQASKDVYSKHIRKRCKIMDNRSTDSRKAVISSLLVALYGHK